MGKSGHVLVGWSSHSAESANFYKLNSCLKQDRKQFRQSASFGVPHSKMYRLNEAFCSTLGIDGPAISISGLVKVCNSDVTVFGVLVSRSGQPWCEAPEVATLLSCRFAELRQSSRTHEMRLLNVEQQMMHPQQDWKDIQWFSVNSEIPVEFWEGTTVSFTETSYHLIDIIYIWKSLQEPTRYLLKHIWVERLQ